MKLWIDEDIEAPEGYIGAKTVTHARVYLMDSSCRESIDLIDIGDDGRRAVPVRFLEWLEEKGRSFYKIHLHGTNEADKEILRGIIKRNNWEEV